MVIPAIDGFFFGILKDNFLAFFISLTSVIFFSFTKDYPCGKISTQKLQKKINNKVITCKILDVDRYKRFIGECYKRNLNLNSWLVSNGYALAYRKYSKKYISNEINAKNEKKGLWQGKFEMPWDFRRKK